MKRILNPICVVFLVGLSGCASVLTTEVSSSIEVSSKAGQPLIRTYTEPELSGLSEQSKYPGIDDVCVLLNSNELIQPFELQNHFLIACPKHEEGAIEDRKRQQKAAVVANAKHWAIMRVAKSPEDIKTIKAIEPTPYVSQGGDNAYSKSPLLNPVYGFAEVTEEIGSYHEWLEEKFNKIPNTMHPVFRERLYYLLSSYVSGISQKDNTILPVEFDENIATTFKWAEKLGIFGGSLLYESFKQPTSPSIETINKIPSNFQISIDNDRIVLASKKDIWSVNAPYYFMIQNLGTIGRYKDVSSDTHAVAISTGAARDNSAKGQSQATITVFYASQLSAKELSNDVLGLLGIPNNSKFFDLGIESRSSQYVYDASENIHKEATFWDTNTGAFGIGYLGVDGTYQTNRIHFLEFLKQFEYR